MSSIKDFLIEEEQSYYRDRPDVRKDNDGVCEICGTKYSYYYYRDNTPGFRCTDEDILPCKCGKHYGWVRENPEGYCYHPDTGEYTR